MLICCMKFQEEDIVFGVFKFIANTPQFGKHTHLHTLHVSTIYFQ